MVMNISSYLNFCLVLFLILGGLKISCNTELDQKTVNDTNDKQNSVTSANSQENSLQDTQKRISGLYQKLFNIQTDFKKKLSEFVGKFKNVVQKGNSTESPLETVNPQKTNSDTSQSPLISNKSNQENTGVLL